jgi:hypothetical protein
MGKHLPNVITKTSTADVLVALAKAWKALFGTAPKRASLDVLTAQWALETGWGKSCHCYNLGNVKGKVGGDRNWTFFACNEILSSAAAHHMAQADPEHAKITQDNGKSATIWFYPPHSGCCFRAFDTIDAGAADYLATLNKRFSGAWPAVLAGDPEAFSLKLKELRYYTASVKLYTSVLKKTYATVASVKIDLDVLEEHDEPTRDELAALMKMSEAEAAISSVLDDEHVLDNDADKLDALKEI